ncbi:uncharacterized protein LOC142162268 [Nicotiana tabacum]|uniref:Uncharacterized protein LOC142162268 n=1 Tax=Nicotiana tabacum TaxID=4097 RepID=A0AC58RPP1_TOBAC
MSPYLEVRKKESTNSNYRNQFQLPFRSRLKMMERKRHKIFIRYDRHSTGSGCPQVNFDLIFPPIKQKKRLIAEVRNMFVKEEFGVPKEIACDNGPQFIGFKITKFLEGLKVKRITSSSYHPTANGQEVSTNKVIIQDLKKKLEDAKGRCPEELLTVLWAYRTTTKSSTVKIPFPLVYGAKDLISVEIGEPTMRYYRVNEQENDEAMLIKLDLLEEHQNLAYVRMMAQKQRIERYYNYRKHLCYFKVGDLVLRKITHNTWEVNAGKLRPIWEKPDRI